MKSKIIGLIFVSLMFGCENDVTPKRLQETHMGGIFEVIVLDSCEYITGNYRLAHKGNCKYCLERNKKNCK